MKKYIAATIAILITTSAFASDLPLNFDYSFWGRGVFTPLALSGEFSSVSAATATWDNDAFARLGFTMSAYSSVRTIGIVITSFWETGVPTIGEQAHIWVKPLAVLGNESLNDMLIMRIGKWEINDFRGQLGAVEFGSWMVPEGVQDEDTFFSRFASDSGTHIALRPLQFWNSPWNGLTLMAGVGSSYGGFRAYMNTYPWKASDVYMSGHYALGYELPNIGLARVQFIGQNREVWIEDYPSQGERGAYRLMQGLQMNRDADVIEAAFTLTSFDNLKVEIGFKKPLLFETEARNYTYFRGVYPFDAPFRTGPSWGDNELEIQYPTTLSVGASFINNDFDTMIRVDTSFGGNYKDIGIREITEGTALGILGSVSYEFVQNIQFGLDIGFNYKALDTITYADGTTENLGERDTDIETTERMDVGFAPWVQLNLGGGRLKAGVAVMLPSSERWRFTGTGWSQIFTGEPVISFPISVTYSF